ncbi:hypothetical protein Q3G72_017146 [Acer saccharum]|nr:hypothetical protein Q3G72_017146 [Acer saccharum]
MLGPVRGTLVTFTSELLSAINSSCVVLEVVSEVYDQPMAVEGRGSPIILLPQKIDRRPRCHEFRCQSASSSEDLLGPARFSHYLKSVSSRIWIWAFPLRSSACRSKVIGEGGKSLFITPLSPEPPGKTLGLQSADEGISRGLFDFNGFEKTCLHF